MDSQALQAIFIADNALQAADDAIQTAMQAEAVAAIAISKVKGADE
ncbi:hypothetical protein [Heyndrickxia sporothermodurans]